MSACFPKLCKLYVGIVYQFPCLRGPGDITIAEGYMKVKNGKKILNKHNQLAQPMLIPKESVNALALVFPKVSIIDFQKLVAKPPSKVYSPSDMLGKQLRDRKPPLQGS